MTPAPGASEVLTVDVTPGAGAAGGSCGTSCVRGYRDGAAPDWWDTVQMDTWVFGL